MGPPSVSAAGCSRKKGSTKSINPWSVDSIQDFYVIKCPECDFNTGIKEENSFQNHAVENHPMSFAFFGSLSDNSRSPIKKHLRLENGASRVNKGSGSTTHLAAGSGSTAVTVGGEAAPASRRRLSPCVVTRRLDQLQMMLRCRGTPSSRS